MKTIAIDIDDVLSEFGQAFTDFHNNHYGTTFTVEDFNTEGSWAGYYEQALCKLLDNPDGEQEYRNRFVEFLDSDEHAEGQRIPEEVKDCVRKLANDYRLIVVTARDERLRERTVKWLESSLPGLIQEYYFISNWRYKKKLTKAEVCKSAGADYLIDDNVEHCNVAAENGITPILFGEYGWNMNVDLHENVTRASSWKEVMDFFSKNY